MFNIYILIYIYLKPVQIKKIQFDFKNVIFLPELLKFIGNSKIPRKPFGICYITYEEILFKKYQDYVIR